MLAKVYVFLLVAVIGINGWNVEIPEKDKADMKIGQKKYIGCTVSLEKNETKDIMPVITWFKNGVMVEPEQILSRGANKNGTMTKTLYFENPTQDDNGAYTCLVTIYGSQVTKNESLNVNFKVGAKFIEIQKEHYFMEGKMAKISCSVMGDDVTIEWFKNGTAIKASSQYSFTNGGQLLMITNFSKQDSGLYSCRWNQDRQHETMNIEAIAYEKPQFIQFTVNNAMEGQYFEVQCLASGVPKPTIQWSKTSKVSTQMLPGYYDSYKNGSLILSNVSLSDAGSYICVAKSLFDTITRVVDINVIAKPQIVSFKEMVEGNKGDNITLTCKFLAQGSSVARWIKNGEKNETIIEQQFVASNKTQTLNLMLKTIEKNDTSSYTCEVANNAGMVSHIVQFNVHVSPKVKSHHIVRPVVVFPPANIVLSCSAIGYPEPTWTWYFNNGTHNSDLKLAKHAKITIEGGISKLNISELSESHIGNYTCAARNRHGNDSAIISVIKLVPPNTPSLNCFAGNTTDSIHCTDNELMNGTILNPPQSYMVYYLEENDANVACCSNETTFKNCTPMKKEVTNEEGHLWIFDLKPSTKYVLQVVAVNEAGESKTSSCIHVSTQISATSIWAIVFYVIMVLLALAILIDLICCITKNKGMIASLYRRCRSKLQRNEDNPILEETEIRTYESNIITSSGSNRAPLYV